MPANQNRNGDMHNEVLRLGGPDVAMDYTPVVRRTES